MSSRFLEHAENTRWICLILGVLYILICHTPYSSTG